MTEGRGNDKGDLMSKYYYKNSASIKTLKKRAEILARIREFFAKRNVLEVETQALSHATVTDPHIKSISADFQNFGSSEKQTLYLQTSPEYAMKRLLVRGSGSIYQICKAYRQGEIGKQHQPEFTMLEWYRVGFNHHDLMDEMSEFFQEVLSISNTERKTYLDVFTQYLNINPHTASAKDLSTIAKSKGLSIEGEYDKNTWLDVLFSKHIEPNLGVSSPVFVYDYPDSMAALAKVRHEKYKLASRFEVYFRGVELANGFHELQDAMEQRARFKKDLEYRKKSNLENLDIDEHFLNDLEQGLPDCAGVALGVDRLIMLALSYDKISDVVCFEFCS